MQMVTSYKYKNTNTWIASVIQYLRKKSDDSPYSAPQIKVWADSARCQGHIVTTGPHVPRLSSKVIRTSLTMLSPVFNLLSHC